MNPKERAKTLFDRAKKFDDSWELSKSKAKALMTHLSSFKNRFSERTDRYWNRVSKEIDKL